MEASRSFGHLFPGEVPPLQTAEADKAANPITAHFAGRRTEDNEGDHTGATVGSDEVYTPWDQLRAIEDVGTGTIFTAYDSSQAVVGAPEYYSPEDDPRRRLE